MSIKEIIKIKFVHTVINQNNESTKSFVLKIGKISFPFSLFLT